MSTAIISGFMMITLHFMTSASLQLGPGNKFLLYVKARWRSFLVAAKWEYTCKHRV